MECAAADVPPFFICPISLDIMKDPVTISSGMTFDRESIHKWLFFYNHGICPITKQALAHKLLTPNSNLLRLIQSWLQMINHHPDEKENPELPVLDINSLLEELKRGSSRMRSVRTMKAMIRESDGYRIAMEDAGVGKAVVSSLASEIQNLDSEIGIDLECLEFMEEAVSLMYCLKLPKEKLKKLLEDDENGEFVSSLSVLLIQQMNTRAKAEIVSLLRSTFQAVDDLHGIELRPELFQGILEILKDQNSGGGSTAALATLIEILRDENNRRKAVDAGFVPVLIELLSESVGRRLCEQILLVLGNLCKVGVGRAAVLDHPAGMAVVSAKILKVSHVANDRAVSLILSLFRYCKAEAVAWELMEVGGVAKMCMVVQSACRAHTKHNAREILGFYLKSSDKFPCLPSRFIL